MPFWTFSVIRLAFRSAAGQTIRLSTCASSRNALILLAWLVDFTNRHISKTCWSLALAPTFPSSAQSDSAYWCARWRTPTPESLAHRCPSHDNHFFHSGTKSISDLYASTNRLAFARSVRPEPSSARKENRLSSFPCVFANLLLLSRSFPNSPASVAFLMPSSSFRRRSCSLNGGKHRELKSCNSGHPCFADKPNRPMVAAASRIRS